MTTIVVIRRLKVNPSYSRSSCFVSSFRVFRPKILYYTIYDPKFVILPMQFDVIVELLNILVKFTVLL